MNNRENQEQKSLFEWAMLYEGRYPELKMLFHVPNEGKRSKATGAEMVRMGLKSGVPDVVLPVARQGYHGLVIEMKEDRGKLTQKQKEWLRMFSAENWKVLVCWGWDCAADAIAKYLGFEAGLVGKLAKLEEFSE